MAIRVPGIAKLEPQRGLRVPTVPTEFVMMAAADLHDAGMLAEPLPPLPEPKASDAPT